MISVLDHGAVGDGATDDTAAIDAALTAAAAGEAVLIPGGRTYRTRGGHRLAPGVTIHADGAIIEHTGTGVAFTLSPQGAFNLTRGGGITGATIHGTPYGAAAIELGNAWGLHVRDVTIHGYTTGIGIDLHNRAHWCEGTTIDNVMILETRTGVRFHRSGGGDFSFGYTQIHGLSINVPAHGIGIDVGSEATDVIYLYNADLRVTCWLLGEGAVGILWGQHASMDGSRLHVTGEIPGNAHNAVGVVGLRNLGGTLKATGHLRIKGAPTDTAAGVTRILSHDGVVDSAAGSNATGRYTTWGTANLDQPHEASIGHVVGPDRSTPYVAGYAGSDILHAYSVPYGGSPANAPRRFSVSTHGDLTYGRHDIRALTGGGDPTGIVAPAGSTYARPGENPWLPLYVSRGGGRWHRLLPWLAGSTAQRPAPAGLAPGLMYTDLTLGRPIWWAADRWVDATGSTV